jgi:hypothetical protein
VLRVGVPGLSFIIYLLFYLVGLGAPSLAARRVRPDRPPSRSSELEVAGPGLEGGQVAILRPYAAVW